MAKSSATLLAEVEDLLALWQRPLIPQTVEDYQRGVDFARRLGDAISRARARIVEEACERYVVVPYESAAYGVVWSVAIPDATYMTKHGRTELRHVVFMDDFHKAGVSAIVQRSVAEDMAAALNLGRQHRLRKDA